LCCIFTEYDKLHIVVHTYSVNPYIPCRHGKGEPEVRSHGKGARQIETKQPDGWQQAENRGVQGVSDGPRERSYLAWP
jgi:hypothetical protein